MKKTFALLFVFIFCLSTSISAQTDKKLIEQSVINFLNWHKKPKIDSVNKSYSIIKNIITDKKWKKQTIDKVGLEKYLSFFKRCNFLSQTYINSMRKCFYDIGREMNKNPPIQRGAIVKIDGLDKDIILDTFEPEAILDNLGNAKITKSLIIYNKAMVGINFANGVDMIFILTKQDKNWLIDYIGHDNTSMDSFLGNNT
jgi:hypothetical protein